MPTHSVGGTSQMIPRITSWCKIVSTFSFRPCGIWTGIRNSFLQTLGFLGCWFFFPSAADKAQRLGPEGWINVNHSTKDKHNVQVKRGSGNKQTKQEKTTNTDDPQIPQPDLRCLKCENSKTTADRSQRGKSPPMPSDSCNLKILAGEAKWFATSKRISSQLPRPKTNELGDSAANAAKWKCDSTCTC